MTGDAALARMLADAAETERIGAALGRALRAGDCVALSGPLGAGKSALARAAIQARLRDAGRDEEAPSPSYTLVQSYEAAGVEIRHADLYRLSELDEIDELGLFEQAETAILIVEWGERLGARAPERLLAIALDLPADGRGRSLAAAARGGGWDAAIAALEGAGG